MMLQELCCCLLLFSGVAPSAALRATIDSSLDLNTGGQFSLTQTLKEQPGMTENLVTNMRPIIEENLFKGSPELSAQPTSHDPEIEGQVASMLQQVQASSLDGKFVEQAESAKIPAERTQVLLEMGSNVKELLNRPQLAKTISGTVSKVQKFIEEHPKIDGEIERYAEHARPSEHPGPQPLPPSLTAEVPDLAKKLLPMFKPTVLALGQSNVSLLRSSTDESSDTEADPAAYTRFEASISLVFPLPCTSSACFKIPVTLLMVKLLPYAANSSYSAAGPGFVILVPGLSVTLEKASFGFSPFIPVSPPEVLKKFLPAMKSGFIASVGWKEANITKLDAGKKGPPVIKIAVGCSYLPISVESKTLPWGARTEPMIELAGSYNSAKESWGFGTTFKWRNALSYNKHQFFAIFKFPLVAVTGSKTAGPGWPSAIAFGLLYHISPPLAR